LAGIGIVGRLFGWAALLPVELRHSCRRQPVRDTPDAPSHSIRQYKNG
jgi:hypothetical protein